MKHKFSLIWRVAVALVLVLSFSLVAAVPVAASPDVSNVWVQLTHATPADAYNADKTGVIYHVYFTPGANLTKNVDTVSVLFPNAVGGTIAAADVTVDLDGDGVTKSPVAATAVVSSTTSSSVVCTIPVDLTAGTEALISIAKVTNPTAGAKTLKVQTSQETTWADSASYTIGATLVTGVGFALGAATAGTAGTYTVTFTTARALVGGLDTVTVIFPTGTTVPSSIAKAHVKENDVLVTSVAATVFGRFVTVTVPSDIGTTGGVSLVFDATSGLRNGTLATAPAGGTDDAQNDLLHPGEYVGKVYTNRDSAIVSDGSPYTIEPGPISKLGFGATSTSPSDTLVVKDAVSGNIYVQTQDQYGNLKVVGADLDVTLSSDTTGTATYSANPVTITNGGGANCEVSFTYQDTAAGTWTITASPPATTTYAPATWVIQVEAAHVIALYNATGGLVDDTYTTIQAAVTDALANYTVKVSPGTYTENITTSAVASGVTIESTDGAASTIIYGAAGAGTDVVRVASTNLTLDGFTIKGNKAASEWGIYVQNTGFILQNNIVTDCYEDGIFVESSQNAITSGLIDNNTITGLGSATEPSSCGILVEGCANNISGVTISNNTISNYGITTTGTGSGNNGIKLADTGSGTVTNTTISGNNISGCYSGLWLRGSLTGMTGARAIADNTISGCRYGVVVTAKSTGQPCDSAFSLVNNAITGNTVYGVHFYDRRTTALTGIKSLQFNDISGNGTYGIYNDFASVTNAPDASHNWWGDASGPSGVGAGSGDVVSANVTYDPWLGASVSAGETATGVASLDAQSTVGVKVSGVAGFSATIPATLIGAALYAANPQTTPTFTPLENGFFDVFVKNPGGATATTEIGIKFYDAAITSNSVAYMWDAFEETWKLCTEQSTISGMVWVKARPHSLTVPAVPTIEDLAGTPFAISTAAPAVTKGDFDVDNDVDFDDFVAFGDCYGSELGDANYNAIGDFDDSGAIDFDDFVAFGDVYGTSW